ncbi:hypothetical protein IL306_013517, partial [Fusarium sp. DS 682]
HRIHQSAIMSNTNVALTNEAKLLAETEVSITINDIYKYLNHVPKNTWVACKLPGITNLFPIRDIQNATEQEMKYYLVGFMKGGSGGPIRLNTAEEILAEAEFSFALRPY